MKRVISLAVLLGATLGFYSCKKTINCETPLIRKVLFFSPLTSLKVPDTSAVVNKFRKGSDFGQLSETFPAVKLVKVGVTDKSMEIPMKGEETYDYDWQITLKPSNRVYYISKISHESATSKTHYCTNTVTYKLNDSLVTVPGNPYSTVPYYPSDIHIQYFN
jgi:hypothetical protein